MSRTSRRGDLPSSAAPSPGVVPAAGRGSFLPSSYRCDPAVDGDGGTGVVPEVGPEKMEDQLCDLDGRSIAAHPASR